MISSLNPLAAASRLRRRMRFERQYLRFCADASRKRALIPDRRDMYRIYGEDTADTRYEPHYTYHCAWACRVLADSKPEHHIDIASSLNFVSMASAWIDMTHYDYRPPRIALAKLNVASADLTNLHFASESIKSLSCMHVLEHIGLGRYGDLLDAAGDRRAADELGRVLARSGRLLFVAPVGRRRVNFNAHRVYSMADVLSLFPTLRLQSCALVPDDYEQGLVDSPSPELMDSQEWGCGCFVFEKV